MSLFRWVRAVGLVVFLSGCGAGSQSPVKITLRIAPPERLLSDPIRRLWRPLQRSGVDSALDHACFALSVSGSGIEPFSLPALIDSDCADLGALSEAVTPAQATDQGVSLSVSPGTQRRVRLFGLDVEDAFDCSSLTTVLTDAPPDFNVVGEAVVDLVADMTLPLSNSYSSGGGSALDGCVSPSISSFFPTSGTVAGGQELTFSGTGFLKGADITVGGLPCRDPVRLAAGQIQCTTPPGSGSQPVQVSNPGGFSDGTTGFIYTADAFDGGGPWTGGSNPFSPSSLVAVGAGAFEGNLYLTFSAPTWGILKQTNLVTGAFSAVSSPLNDSLDGRPSFAEWNSKLYLAVSRAGMDVRVAVTADGSSFSLLTNQPTQASLGRDPHLTAFDGGLYLILTDSPSSSRVLVQRFEDTGGTTWVEQRQLSKVTTEDAEQGYLHVHGGRLFATWTEETSGSGPNQIRVARKQVGSADWDLVDGDEAEGINWKPGQTAHSPVLATHNGKLYCFWVEFNSVATKDQVRGAVWDGDDEWKPLNESAAGFNVSGSKDASQISALTFQGRLFLAWLETDGSDRRIFAGTYDGNDEDGPATITFPNGGTQDNADLEPDGLYEGNDPQLINVGDILFLVHREQFGANVSLQRFYRDLSR